MKTSELTGPALNYAVALANGWEVDEGMWITDPKQAGTGQPLSDHNPSTDWEQGGPIIDREKISLRQWTNVPIVHAYMPEGEWSSDGDSPLIAAMRCYVASKLGDEVEIPEELS